MSIERAFKHRNPRHMTVDRYVSRYDLKTVNDCYKFTFVRNPWDKLVSWYFYHKSQKIYKPKTVEGFQSWVRNNCPHHWVSIDNTKWKGNNPLACSEWLTNSHNIHMDFIGRMENIDNDFKAICEAAGVVDVKLPHVNKSSHEHYAEYYDDETRQLVAEAYSEDINRFGYTFE